MSNSHRLVLLGAALGFLVFTHDAGAALSGKQRCLDAKHRAVGKHLACLLKESGAAVRRGDVADFTDCDEALAGAFGDAETRYAPTCPTTGDAPGLVARDLALLGALDVLLDPLAAGPTELGCALGKLKAAGKRASCGAKAQSLVIRKNLLSRDLDKCDAKLESAFASLESGGDCPPGGAAGDVAAAIDAAFGEIEADLADLGTEDFARRGRHRAGSRTITFVDPTRATDPNGGFAGAPDRTFETTIWYPAESALPGAAFPDEGGPWPLVIRAHGFSGFRNDSLDLTRHLASRGMIVVSTDFPLSNLNAPGGPTLLDLDEQVVDVRFLIDRLLELGATPGDPFEGRVDASRIGVTGHSLGGATVLGAAIHPTLGDPRIDAVVALAPFACVFQEAFFEGDTTPLLIVAGSADLVTQPTSHQVEVFGRSDAEKFLVTLDGGLHIGFSDDFLNDDSRNGDDVLACPALLAPGSPRPVMPDWSIPTDFLGGIDAGVDTTGSTCEPLCPPATSEWMAHDRQRDLTLAAAAAMFEKVFDGDVSADRFLTSRIDTDNDDVTLAFER